MQRGAGRLEILARCRRPGVPGGGAQGGAEGAPVTPKTKSNSTSKTRMLNLTTRVTLRCRFSLIFVAKVFLARDREGRAAEGPSRAR